MPPEQPQDASNAIREMETVLREILTEWRRVFNSDDYKKNKPPARQRVRELARKYRNLEKVIDALKKAKIEWGILPGDRLGEAHRDRNPKGITLNETWRAMRAAVLAQVLAHEAVHLLTQSEGNSIDQEIRCRRKEQEVWELMKDRAPGDAIDLACRNLARLMAEDEAVIRRRLRQLYPNAPEHDRPKKAKPGGGEGGKKSKKKEKKKKGRMKIEKAQNGLVAAGALLVAFLSNLVRLLFRGEPTEQAYTFDAAWPAGYTSHETRGSETPFVGVIGVSERKGPRGLPATLSVIESPDIIHGGEWASYANASEHRRVVLERLGVDEGEGGGEMESSVEVIEDGPCDVAGLPGHCLEVEHSIHFPEGQLEDPWTRVRERTLYTQRDERIYTITLSAEAEAWSEFAGDLEALLETLEL